MSWILLIPRSCMLLQSERVTIAHPVAAGDGEFISSPCRSLALAPQVFDGEVPRRYNPAESRVNRERHAATLERRLERVGGIVPHPRHSLEQTRSESRQDKNGANLYDQGDGPCQASSGIVCPDSGVVWLLSGQSLEATFEQQVDAMYRRSLTPRRASALSGATRSRAPLGGLAGACASGEVGCWRARACWLTAPRSSAMCTTPVRSNPRPRKPPCRLCEGRLPGA